MDFEKSFTYITEDQDWVKKIGIASLLWLFVLGIFAVIGWALEIARRVANDDETPLPDWENMADYFLTGLKVAVVSFTWSIPLIAIAVCVFTPLIFIQDLGEDWVTFVALIANIGFFLIALVYSLILNLLGIPMALQIAEGKSIGSAINPVGAVRMLRANPGGYAIAALAGGLLSLVLSTLGLLVCLVGTAAGSAFSAAVMAHLIGQAHRRAEINLATTPNPV